jgi:hypothetical protein
MPVSVIDALEVVQIHHNAREGVSITPGTGHLSREAGQRCNFASDMAEGIRVWPANGFRNPLIFYRPMNEGVEIVRVLHGARDIESLFHEGKEP